MHKKQHEKGPGGVLCEKLINEQLRTASLAEQRGQGSDMKYGQSKGQAELYSILNVLARNLNLMQSWTGGLWKEFRGK